MATPSRAGGQPRGLAPHPLSGLTLGHLQARILPQWSLPSTRHRAGPQADPPQNSLAPPTVHGASATSHESRAAFLLSRSPLSDMHTAGAQLMSGLPSPNEGAFTPAVILAGKSVCAPGCQLTGRACVDTGMGVSPAPTCSFAAHPCKMMEPNWCSAGTTPTDTSRVTLKPAMSWQPAALLRQQCRGVAAVGGGRVGWARRVSKPARPGQSFTRASASVAWELVGFNIIRSTCFSAVGTLDSFPFTHGPLGLGGALGH